MCRFVHYLGKPITLASLVTEPAHSIIHQSAHAHETEEPLNGDGFGLAWYAPEVARGPALFRSVSPAWSNQNLVELARVTRSPCILAHVRAATSGLAVAEQNCHPFTSGPYAFMHNGDVARFHQIKRRLLADLTDGAFSAIKGSTDSEHIFAVFLDEMSDVDGASLSTPSPDTSSSPASGASSGSQTHNSPSSRAELLSRALERAVARVVAVSREAQQHYPRPPHVKPDEDHSYINIVVTDGEHSAACRFTTDHDEPSSLYVHAGAHANRAGGAVMIASEPLTNDPGWRKVPRNHVVAVHAGGVVTWRAMQGLEDSGALTQPRTNLEAA